MAKKKAKTEKTAKVEKKEKAVREERNFVVVYNGVAGKKASTEAEAISIAKAYIADETKKPRIKKADIYQLVRKVE